MRRKERYREEGRENKLFKRESFKSPHHYTKLIISSYLWSVRLRSPVTINPDYTEQKNLRGRRLKGCNRAVIFKTKKYFDSKTPFKKKSRHILIKCVRHRWLAEVEWGTWSPTCLFLRQVHETSGLQSTQFKTSVPFLGKASTLLPQETCYYLILTCKPISSYSLISCNLLSHRRLPKARPEWAVQLKECMVIYGQQKQE